MKKLFFTLIIPIFTSTVFCQIPDNYASDSVNPENRSNKKNSYWVVYDKETKKKVEEGKFVNNRRVGIWKRYYTSGKIMQEITYEWNFPNGKARFYYENGHVREEGTWAIDRWIGEYRYYYPNGRPQYILNYNALGKRNGSQNYYYEDGNLQMSGVWKEGKMDGIIKEFDREGSVAIEKNFKDGVLISSSVKTIKKKEEIIPIKEVKDTLIVSDAELDVFDGNGYHRLYDKNSKIAREGIFREGKLIEGKHYLYNAQGELKRVRIYEEGRVIKTIKDPTKAEFPGQMQ